MTRSRLVPRRTLLVSAAALAAAARFGKAKADTPGVSATEIKIGNTCPYSGPASAYGAVGRCLVGYFKRLNEQGGIDGRQITLISLDDGYSPPRTVEQTRRLVEQEGVAFTLGQLGTPTNTAIRRYMNQNRVPHLFVTSGADKWSDYEHFPWTIGWAPSYRIEASIYAKYAADTKSDGKIGVLFQNDDFGKDYLIGLKDFLGDSYAKRVVKEVSYEVTDPTIDSQVVSLRSSGADILVTAATAKFGAQVVRRIYDIGWTPLHFICNSSMSVAAVLKPAGPERAIGLITATCVKDSGDPTWADDSGMHEWRAFMAKYLPDSDVSEWSYALAYCEAQTAEQMLRQCDGDFSRDNLLRQATNLHDVKCGMLLPGIKVSTSPTNHRPVRQLRLQRWTGERWELFGDVIEGSSI